MPDTRPVEPLTREEIGYAQGGIALLQIQQDCAERRGDHATAQMFERYVIAVARATIYAEYAAGLPLTTKL